MAKPQENLTPFFAKPKKRGKIGGMKWATWRTRIYNFGCTPGSRLSSRPLGWAAATILRLFQWARIALQRWRLAVGGMRCIPDKPSRPADYDRLPLVLLGPGGDFTTAIWPWDV